MINRPESLKNIAISEFDYPLPDDRIAKYPLTERDMSKLLVYRDSAIYHTVFTDIENILSPGDELIFNNTRVIPARLFGQKASGGKLEILVERLLDDERVLAHVRASKSPKPGSKIFIEGGGEAQMLARHDALFELRFDQSVLPLLERVGHMPLPPYIDRPDESADRERYQTVYAERAGAVAAPTAGLHFDEALLAAIHAKGVDTAFVTLHVDNLRGENAHHQCETVFKAFARALRMAVEPDPRAAGTIPSTKGSL